MNDARTPLADFFSILLVHLFSGIYDEQNMTVRLTLDDGHYQGELAPDVSLADVTPLLLRFDHTPPVLERPTRRWVVATLPGHGEVIIKREETPRWPSRWIKLLFGYSKLANTWQAATAFSAGGHPTPKPIAFFQKRLCGIPVPKSYFLSQFIPTGQTLRPFLADPETTPVIRDALIEQIIGEIQRLHRRGLSHGDLKGDNILVTRSPLRVYFIDLEGGGITRSPRRQRKDIGRFHRELIGLVPRREQKQWIEKYGSGSAIPLARQTESFEKMASRNRRTLIDRVRRNPSHLAKLRFGLSRILVIQTRYVGDTLLITPVLDGLRHAFPETPVTALVAKGSEAVLMRHPAVDEILRLDPSSSLRAQARFLLDIRRRKFDLSIDLTRSDRSAIAGYASGAPLRVGYAFGRLIQDRLFYNLPTQTGQAGQRIVHKIDEHLNLLRSLGLTPISDAPTLHLSGEEIWQAEARMKQERFDRPFVLFHPGARRWYKSWPPEFFSALGDRIARETEMPVVWVGGPSDIETVRRIRSGMTCPSVDLAGRMTLREMAGIMKLGSVCVVNDSGPMHIAAAVGTPTVALFGLTDPARWGPRGPTHRIISRDCPCRPFGHRRECDQGGKHCMRTISVDEVFHAVINAKKAE
jgi:lipopolysaccharide heptosyltransferase II